MDSRPRTMLRGKSTNVYNPAIQSNTLNTRPFILSFQSLTSTPSPSIANFNLIRKNKNAQILKY